MEYNLQNFISVYFALIIILIGLFIALLNTVFLKREEIRGFYMEIALILIVAVSDYVEQWLSTLPRLPVGRLWLSAIGYSLRPMILVLLIVMLEKSVAIVFAVLEAVNVLAAFSVFFTPVVYYFSEDNHFHRGPLGLFPFLFGLVCLISLLVVTVHYTGARTLAERALMFFIAFAGIGAMFLSSWWAVPNIFNEVMAIAMLLYFTYLHIQMTKRNALTHLLNRQSYYSDLERNARKIRMVYSIDMNDLKYFNDTYGHAAGDRALETVAEAIRTSADASSRVYRIGGDEFAILSTSSHEQPEEVAEKIRRKLSLTGYSCAIGYESVGRDENAEEALKRADRKMYEDKARYKESHKVSTLELLHETEQDQKSGSSGEETQGSPRTSMDSLLNFIGERLQCSRIYIFSRNPQETYSCVKEWCSPETVSKKENFQNLSSELCEPLYEHFRQGKVITVRKLEELKDQDSELYRKLDSMGLRSLIAAQLVYEGRDLGFFGITNPSPDKFDEVSLVVEMMGYYVSALLYSQEVIHKLERVGLRDRLTRAGNRYALFEKVDQLDHNRSIGVLLFNLINVQEINEEKGHLEGDAALIRVATILNHRFGDENVYRSGGNEFVVVSSGIDAAELETALSDAREDFLSGDLDVSCKVNWRAAYDGDFGALLEFRQDKV